MSTLPAAKASVGLRYQTGSLARAIHTPMYSLQALDTCASIGIPKSASTIFNHEKALGA